MSNAVDLNCRLAELLGINWRTHDVVGFTLQVHNKRLPTVCVVRELSPMGEVDRALRTTTERFTLQPTPAFDLDAMVADAQAAVAGVADNAARRESAAVARSFEQARTTFDKSREEWEDRRWQGRPMARMLNAYYHRCLATASIRGLA